MSSRRNRAVSGQWSEVLQEHRGPRYDPPPPPPRAAAVVEAQNHVHRLAVPVWPWHKGSRSHPRTHIDIWDVCSASGGLRDAVPRCEPLRDVALDPTRSGRGFQMFYNAEHAPPSRKCPALVLWYPGCIRRLFSNRCADSAHKLGRAVSRCRAATGQVESSLWPSASRVHGVALRGMGLPLL